VAAPRKTGSRAALGREIDELLADFCAANYGAYAVNVVREAVRDHIARRLAEEPDLRERFESAKQQRAEQKTSRAGLAIGLGLSPSDPVKKKPKLLQR